MDQTQFGLKKRQGIRKTRFKLNNIKVRAFEKHKKLHIYSSNFKKYYSCFKANLYQDRRQSCKQNMLRGNGLR